MDSWICFGLHFVTTQTVVSLSSLRTFRIFFLLFFKYIRLRTMYYFLLLALFMRAFCYGEVGCQWASPRKIEWETISWYTQYVLHLRKMCQRVECFFCLCLHIFRTQCNILWVLETLYRVRFFSSPAHKYPYTCVGWAFINFVTNINACRVERRQQWRSPGLVEFLPLLGTTTFIFAFFKYSIDISRMWRLFVRVEVGSN